MKDNKTNNKINSPSLTFPHFDWPSGEERRKGSAIPDVYRLVRPLGKGIPLSDVNIISVSSRWPACLSSSSTRLIPKQDDGESLRNASVAQMCVTVPNNIYFSPYTCTYSIMGFHRHEFCIL